MPSTNSIVYLGIDPGKQGGFASIATQQDHEQVTFKKMPASEQGVHDTIVKMTSHKQATIYVAIEQVSGFIGKAHPGSSMFKFGMGYGGLRMALVAAGLDFVAVPPKTWQKTFGLKKLREESDSSWKYRLKDLAEAIFPRLKLTLSTADALLIAEHLRRLHKGAIRAFST